ncbi:MAG: ankyrin repeat domain-containing protein [Candidatus Micrarchaeota archaeon]|nr:ankyrin repeat domain-containing protein [Candidatus Micrarchaeota archaeon]
MDERDAKGRTRLMWAALGGRGEEVEALLDEGSDPNLKDYSGETALDLAFRQAEVSVVEQVDSEMRWRVVEGYQNTVKLLLDHGARANHGETYEAICERLRKYRADGSKSPFG